MNTKTYCKHKRAQVCVTPILKIIMIPAKSSSNSLHLQSLSSVKKRKFEILKQSESTSGRRRRKLGSSPASRCPSSPSSQEPPDLQRGGGGECLKQSRSFTWEVSFKRVHYTRGELLLLVPGHCQDHLELRWKTIWRFLKPVPKVETVLGIAKQQALPPQHHRQQGQGVQEWDHLAQPSVTFGCLPRAHLTQWQLQR